MNPDEGQIYSLVVGRLVLALRERSGLSQEALASKVGLTQSTLSRIERGQVQPDLFTFRQLAGALGLSVGELSHYVEEAMRRTEQAARRAVGPAERKQEASWWQTALAVAGLAGLVGLVAFAVGASLDNAAHVARSRRKKRG